MTTSAWGFTALLVAATIAFLLRYSGFALMQKVKLSTQLEVFLNRMSTSVLVAIVAAALAQGGTRTAAAVLAGVAAMLLTRSPVAAMLVGVGMGAVWSSLLA